MEPCKRVGIDVTKKCNLRCKTCFYYHRADFNSDENKSIEDVKKEMDVGRLGGCDHAVLVGQGEPLLWPHIQDFVIYGNATGMSTSTITNGCLGIPKYERIFDAGIDHIHLSVHGIGNTFDRIVGVENAHKRQDELKIWLKENKIPWRSNTTLQQENYEQLPQIVEDCIEHGVKHFVFLGFLPHYEWQQPSRMQTVAVHPEKLQLFIEKGIDICEEAGIYTTLRYHPMCHLQEKYWKYVTNANMVVYDNEEWCYNGIWPSATPDAMRRNADALAGIGVSEEPCNKCNARIHCGGWNSVSVKGFDGAGLQPFKGFISQEYGYYFNQNPIRNHGSNWK